MQILRNSVIDVDFIDKVSFLRNTFILMLIFYLFLKTELN